MNDHQWHDVAGAADLSEHHPYGIDVGDLHIVLVRDGASVRALQGTCPHAGAKLENGHYNKGHIVCPWHMATFRVDDGALLEPPALHGLCTYPARLEHGRVFVQTQKIEATPLVSTTALSNIVIVGGGAAATAALIGLRDGGYDGMLTVIESRDEEPIDRTQLSKMALAGKKPLDTLALVAPERYQQLDVRRVHGTVRAIDPQARSLGTEDGQTIAFDRCIIATGAEPVKPDFPGADDERVFTIRTKADVQAILALGQQAQRVAILGTSFIAMEAASALRSANVAVTVVGKSSLPFERLFGSDVAAAIVDLHRAAGVEFLLEEQVDAVAHDGTSLAVELASKKTVSCDFVVVGYGVKPRTAAFANLPLHEDGGILVDERLEALPGIYAVGDLAAVRSINGVQRIEHWRLAQQHGFFVAHTLLGAGKAFDKTPFFWTQQHGKRLVYIGHASDWDEVVIDGDLKSMKFIAWYVKDDAIVAALLCGKEYQTTVLIDRGLALLTLAEARLLSA